MSEIISSIQTIIDRKVKPLLPNQFCIAFSGGIDSVVLLHALKNIIDDKSDIRAIHINHNISNDSTQWADSCRDICLDMGIEIEILSIELNKNGFGIEAAARDARYNKLRENLNKDEILLTAHHEEDQTETIFLRLARGTGLDGIEGIKEQFSFSKGILFRPMLEVSKSSINDYAKEHQLKWIEDPSNADINIDRNFIRKEIIPDFKKRWPLISTSVSRLSQLSVQNKKLLTQVAKEDIGSINNINELPISKISDKTYERANNIIRYLIVANEMSIPSMRVLENGLKDILDPDKKNSTIIWKDYSIKKYKDNLYFLNSSDLKPNCSNIKIPWEIHQKINLDNNIGSIEASFIHGKGLSINKCSKTLSISYRQGGESIKPFGYKIRKTLKNLFQEQAIFPWVRDKIPLIYNQDDLVSVADIWINQNYMASENEDGFEVNWNKKMVIR